MSKKNKTKEKTEPPKSDMIQSIMFQILVIFLGLGLASGQSLISDGLQGSALQKEMDEKQDYNSRWGNLNQIYNNLRSDMFIDLEDSDEPQTDMQFPPMKEAFYDEYSFKKIAQQHKNYNLDATFKSSASAWTFSRPNQIFTGNQHIFNNINPNDINQGAIGDCYFLVVLSSLAETPERVKKIFNQTTPRSSGIYSLDMQIDGMAQKVQIDDQIPTQNGFPVLAHNKQKELWVSFIEKAWAKIHLTYNNTQGGLPSIAYKKITGFPGEKQWGSTQFDWEVILKAEAKNWPMWCGNVVDEGLKYGLVGGHAQSLLSGKEITLDSGSSVKLVKVRNPWGSGEWTGNWSDSSTLWTQSIQSKLGIQSLSFKDDGAFWMEWEDFKKQFQLLSFGYQMDDANQSYYRLNQTGKWYFFIELTGDHSQDLIVTNSFTSDRLLRMQTKTIPNSIWNMGLQEKNDQGKQESVKSNSKADVISSSRDDYDNYIYVENLKAGTYMLYVNFRLQGKADLKKLRSIVGVWGTNQTLKFQQFEEE